MSQNPDAALARAARDNDIGGIRAALAEGAGNLAMALSIAFQARNDQAARYLIDHGGAELLEEVRSSYPTEDFEMPYRVPDWTSPLGEAAAHGCEGAVSLMLERMFYGASFQGEALGLAAMNGHLRIVEALLARGVPASFNDHRALGLAVNHGHLEVAKLLFHASEQPPDWFASACLPLAIERNDAKFCAELLESGADPEAGLLAAARLGDETLLRTLLDAGANLSGEPGTEALRHARAHGPKRALELLEKRLRRERDALAAADKEAAERAAAKAPPREGNDAKPSKKKRAAREARTVRRGGGRR